MWVGVLGGGVWGRGCFRDLEKNCSILDLGGENQCRINNEPRTCEFRDVQGWAMFFRQYDGICYSGRKIITKVGVFN